MGPTSLPPLSTLVRAARAAWPERALSGFQVHDEGWSNLVLEANGRLIFRFPRTRKATESLKFEVQALELLSQRLSARIPVPIRISTLSTPRGWPFIAYHKVPGRPLSGVRTLDSVGTSKLRRFLGTLLGELAALPTRPFVRIGARPGDARSLAGEYRELQGRYGRLVEDRLPPKVRRNLANAFEQFYSNLRESRYHAVVTHRDLGADHILWDSTAGRPSGVIDWGDLCLSDPAFDLTGVGRLGGSRLSDWARSRGAGQDPTFYDRLSFYRQVSPIHGAVYAAETQDAALLRAALERLKRGFGQD